MPDTPEPENPAVWPPPPTVAPPVVAPRTLLTGREWLDKALGFWGLFVLQQLLVLGVIWLIYGDPYAVSVRRQGFGINLASTLFVALLGFVIYFRFRKMYLTLANSAGFGGFMQLVFAVLIYFRH